MSDYLSITPAEREAMLGKIGVGDVSELHADIPATLLKKKVKLSEGRSQQETFRAMKALAARNKNYDSVFLGAGS